MNTVPNPSSSDEWLRPTKPLRLALGVLLGPPVAGLTVGLILVMTAVGDVVAQSQNKALTVIQMGGFAAFYGALVGWPVMLTLGLGSHAVLLRRTSANLLWYVGAGAVSGIVAGLVRAGRAVLYLQEAALLNVAIGIVTGVIAAAIFWIIRRPDKDAVLFKNAA
ncbi:MAG TPA: hypothetical protein VG942_11545 [Hyphomonadaceae bacterium]|nr:hypothetical protein [Hyphomonadaceae bacterium]